MTLLFHRLNILFNKSNTKFICRFKSQSLSKEFLLSETNREKCMEKLRRSHPYNVGDATEKIAAVLIGICENQNKELSILYTLRSRKLTRHVNQVSFPGGIMDTADESYEDCALRETEEEIGLSRDDVEIWGTGKSILPHIKSPIYPVVGHIKNYNEMKLKINPDEVEKVFTVPLRVLCSSENQRHTQFRSAYSIPIYLGGEEKIWGITGLLTHMFLNALLPKEIYRWKIPLLRNYNC